MARPLIKICGVTSRPLLDHVIEVGADMVGLVHFARSPRHLEWAQLEDLIEASRARIASVVLLVEPDDALFAAVSALGPDFIQLHGKETPQRVRALAQTAPNLIKALPVGEPADLEAIPAYRDSVRHLILDAKPPADAARPGGLGTPFDWSLLDALDKDTPFLLSGGLDPDNVGAAIARVNPYGIDVSSGVESTRGEKDRDKITAFVTRARAAHAKETA